MKKQHDKQAKRASKLAKAENLKKKEQELAAKIINVKNAEGDPDTVAEIVAQNQIAYTPKVSVIIPVYNVEPYLRECLDSVVNQSLKEIEIICVDDGSTDKSLDILLEYAKKDKRITVLKQANLHAGVARNAGLAVAKGEYLSFLDSDDFFELNMLEDLHQMAQTEMSQIIYYQYVLYDNNTKSCGRIGGISPKYTCYECITLNTEDLQDDLFTICNPMPWNKLIKKDFIIAENLRYQNLAAANDVCFSLTAIACAEKITLCNKSYVYYRHNRQNSLKNTRDKNPFNFYKAYKGIYNILKNKSLYDKYKKTFLQSLVSSSLWTLAHTDLKYEEVKQFIKNTIIPEFGLLTNNEHIISKSLLSKLKDLYRETIIVSLTSYPARINTTYQAIKSLLQQSMKADKVILWLAQEQFLNKEEDLPQQLLDLCDKGLVIGWCHDIRSYKKLIPSLKKYPDACIITADDDILYPPDWLHKLWSAYTNNKSMIHCHRAHKIKFNGRKILPYNTWDSCISYSNTLPSYKNFCTTGGGVLYPPKVFSPEVFNENIFMELCPNADDIWFWAMCVLNNKKINVVKNNVRRITVVDGSQEEALWKNNVLNNLNDIQISNILQKYPSILTNLIKEKNSNILKSILLFPYYLFKLAKIRETYINLCTKFTLKQLTNLRVDIKNIGSKDNSVQVSGEKLNVSQPQWMVSDKGRGQVVCSSALNNILHIKVIKDGKLHLSFRGQDKRHNGKRLPIWIDYKSIKINGREILSAPISVWHDKPFNYEMPVKNGQEITVEMVQKYHKYTKLSLKEMLQSLCPQTGYMHKNFDSVYRDLCSQIGAVNLSTKSAKTRPTEPQNSFKHFLYHKVKTDSYTKTYVCGIRVRKKPANIYEFIDKRLAAFKTQTEQTHTAQNKQILQQINALSADLQKVKNEINKKVHEYYSDVLIEQEKVNANVLYAIASLNKQLKAIINSVDMIAPLLYQNNQQNQEELLQSIAGIVSDVGNLSKTLQDKSQQNKAELLQNITGVNTAVGNLSKTLQDKSQQNKAELLQNITGVNTTVAGLDKVLQDKIQQNRQMIAEMTSTLASYQSDLTKTQAEIQNKIHDFSTLVGNENNKITDAIVKSGVQQNDGLNSLAKQVADTDKKLSEFKLKAQDNYKELNFADLLHDTILNSPWLKDKSFTLSGWAANYSFIFMLYRILDSVKPQHILEMGMGQTSRLTSQYAAHGNPDATLDIVENDASWIEVYQLQLAKSANTKIHQLDLEFFIHNEVECRKYTGMEEVTDNKKFDLIIVDGPWGANQTLPRSNVLDVIADGHLADDFVIIFDDAERKGESNTINATKSLLTEKGIKFIDFRRNGIKYQHIITSETRSFVQFL